MPDEENKKSVGNRVSDSNRFKYIGFEVFPGKPKDLFKSDEEKAKLVDAVVAKRSRGEVIREECTLFEERVSVSDRLILAVACFVILATLFIPWYSAYNEIVEEVVAVPVSEMPFDGTVTAASSRNVSCTVTNVPGHCTEEVSDHISLNFFKLSFLFRPSSL